MKKKLLLPITALLITSFVFSSCAKSENKPKETSEETTATEETAEETSEETTEETTEATTEDTTPVEPSIVTIESNVYTAAEAPIVVDWDNYQAQGAKPADSNKFTRYSDDTIDSFMPMDDYGAVFPFLATESLGSTENGYYDEYEENFITFRSYGLCDSQGRIICDPVFSDVNILYYSKNIVLEQGEYPDKKIGLIDPAGTKFTQLVYDKVNNTEHGIFARAGKELTVYDEDLNVVMRVPFNINMDTLPFDYITEYDINIYRVLDKEHCIIDLGQGMRYILNMSTGVIGEDYVSELFKDPTVKVNQNEEGYYVEDLNGNRLSDIYPGGCVPNNFCPILKDAEDNCFAINSGGQVIKELGKMNDYRCTTIGDYLLAVSPNGNGTLYDKDFNEIRSLYDTDCYIGNWTSTNSITTPYVKDDKTIINGLTGDVVIENAKNAQTIYIAGDNVAASYYKDGTHYILPGKEIDYTKSDNGTLSYDTITDTPYVVTFTSHHTEVYNIKTGETTKVDAVFQNVYQPEIRNGILGILSKGNTRLFDLNAEGGASEIFCYTATDPIGE